MIAITPPSASSIRKAIKLIGDRPLSWIRIGEEFGDGDRIPELRNSVSVTKFLDLQERIFLVSEKLRQPYIDYIGRISGQHPRDWWRSAAAEKNPYVSNAFFNICATKACIEAVAEAGEKSSFVIVVHDAALRACLYRNLKDTGAAVQLLEGRWQRISRTFRQIAGLFAHESYFIIQNFRMMTWARYVYRLHLTDGVRALMKSGAPICVTYIWVDLRAYSPASGEFEDVDFGRVTEFLRSLGKTVVGLVNIRSSTSYSKVAGRIANSKSAFIVPHAFLTIADIIRAAITSSMRRPPRQSYPAFAGLNVTEIVEGDLEEEWYHVRDFDNVLIERLIERLKSSNIRIERFIYPFENHTWERVICHSLKVNYPSVRTVGYQPNGLPLLLLNYFVSKGETKSIPLPDRVVANGAYPARLLSASGFGGRVVLGGGLRQTYLQGLLYGNEPAPSRTGKGLTVLATPSIGRYRTVELIHKVVEAFRDLPAVNVIIKLHPSMRFDQLKPFLGSLKFPENVTTSVEPILELLPRVDALIYNDGTFPAAEALAFGIPVVFVQPEHGLCLDSLDGFPDIRKTVRSPQEIRDAITGLLESRPSDQYKAAGLEVVRQLVGNVTEDTLRLFSE